MSLLEADYSQCKTFDPLVSGAYHCQVVSFTLADDPKWGGKRVTWKLKVIEGKYAGRNIFYMVSTHGKFSWKLHNFLIALGEQDTKAVDPNAMLGRYIEIRIALKPGAKYPDVTGVNPYFRPGMLADALINDTPF